MITKKVLDSGWPYVPRGTFLNINFPKVDLHEGEERCADVTQWKWVMTRLHNVYSWSDDDVKNIEVCGHHRLPVDEDVVGQRHGECWASISVARSKQYMARAPDQEDVYHRLKDLWSCFSDR